LAGVKNSGCEVRSEEVLFRKIWWGGRRDWRSRKNPRPRELPRLRKQRNEVRAQEIKEVVVWLREGSIGEEMFGLLGRVDLEIEEADQLNLGSLDSMKSWR